MSVTVEADEFIQLHPKLFHVSLGSWSQVSSSGLFSTSELLKQCDQGCHESRQRIARPIPQQLTHPTQGRIWLNDQSPLTDSVLKRSRYPNGMTSGDWVEHLNQHVFFWPTEERLERFLAATKAKERERIVLEVDTRCFVEQYEAAMMFSPQNSGAPHGGNPAQRIKFLPRNQFPFKDWARKRRNRRKAIVEVVLLGMMDKPELLSLRTTIKGV